MPVNGTPLTRYPAPMPLVWSASSKTICAMFMSLAKLWMNALNRTKVHNREQLLKLLENRENRGLITISNHSSCLDDPLMWGILNWRHVFNNQQLRWSTAAQDVCFKKHWHSVSMALGKVIPLNRGDGVYQKTMDFCVREITSGNWVHIFPEGKINIENKAKRLKWGVGRLIADSSTTPIVLPLHHVGLDSILPNQTPYRLHIGQRASVYVGTPLEFSPDIERLKDLDKSPMEVRKYITDRIQEEMAVLKQKAEDFHSSHIQSSSCSTSS